MRLLIVEDNPKTAAALQTGLVESGFAVDTALAGHDGEELALTSDYDAIVLDLMLPDRDGVEVCRNLRRAGKATPILILTALSSTADKVQGLDAGADDYLAKPFEFEELVARLHALLRRGTATESRALRYEDVEVDLSRRTATRAGEKINLSNKEILLLEYFMRNPNRVLSRAMIGEKVWDMNFSSSSNVIDVYVGTLRKKIDRGFDRPLIHTVVGAGYRFGDDPKAEIISKP
jgi:two-component system copper resistance phosphate regulon response regulator CusR